MSQLQQLYQLQQIDSEIQAKKKRLSDVLRAQKETPELIEARQAAEAAAATRQQWRTKRNDLQLELDGVNAEAQRSEKRLYSGNVKNPKELADLQQKIDSLGRRGAALEDEILEAMIMIEDLEETAAAAAEQLTAVEEKWDRAMAAYQQEQNELALRLNDLNQLRPQQEAMIAAPLLRTYNNLRPRKGGIAIVTLKNDRCQGCQLNVPAHIVKEAQEGKQVYCNNCDRLLTVYT